MRFLDYNGNGGLDLQDIATSVVVEEATRVDEQDFDSKPKQLDSNAGCVTDTRRNNATDEDRSGGGES